MKLSIYTILFTVAVIFTGCAMYQSGQMPDDMYYSQGAEAPEFMSMANGRASYGDQGYGYDEDSYLRMKVYNRHRWNAFDSYNAFGTFGGFYGGWGTGIGFYPGFYPGFYGSHFGGGWMNPFAWGPSFGLGWGMGMGGFYDPFFNPFFHGGGFYPYSGFYGYPIGYYGGKFGLGGTYANKPVRSFNTGQYRNGNYNTVNSNSRMNTNNNLGSSFRRMFAPSENRVNNYNNINRTGTQGSYDTRPSRTYTNPVNSPTRSTMSSGSGGAVRSSGGSTGGGVSRPTRNN